MYAPGFIPNVLVSKVAVFVINPAVGRVEEEDGCTCMVQRQQPQGNRQERDRMNDGSAHRCVEAFGVGTH